MKGEMDQDLDVALLKGNGLFLIKTWTCLHAKGNQQVEAEDPGDS